MSKDWFLKFCCGITLNEFDLVKSSTAFSRKQIKREGMAMLIPIFVWLILGGSITYRNTQNMFLSIAAAVLSAFLIALIDIQIVSALSKNGIQKTVRFFISLIIAVITALIADDMFFHNDIELELESLKEVALVKSEESIRNRWEANSIDLRAQIAAKDSTLEASKKTHKDEMQGKDGRPAGNGKVAKALKKYVVSDSTELANLQSKLVVEVTNLNDELKHNHATIASSYASAGPITRIKALFQLMKKETLVIVAYIFFFLLMLSFELYVLLSKAGIKTDYQQKLILTNEFDIARYTLAQGEIQKMIKHEDALTMAERYLNDK